MENPPIVDSEKVGEMATPENRGGTEASQAVKIHPNGMIIRGMTFYKSDQGAMAADDGEPGENCEQKPSNIFGVLPTFWLIPPLFSF